jgi:hypothetical protein
MKIAERKGDRCTTWRVLRGLNVGKRRPWPSQRELAAQVDHIAVDRQSPQPMWLS